MPISNMARSQRAEVVLIIALLMLMSIPYSPVVADEDGACCPSDDFDLFLLGSADDGTLSPFES